MNIKYAVSAVSPNKTIAQTFATAEAALRVRDYLRGKGYVAVVKPLLAVA